jgi:hypothetical protein
VTRVVQQNILRLEITVDHIESVQVFQCKKEFRRIESRSGLVELALSLEVVEEFSAIHKCQHEVEFLSRLERKFEGYDERAVDLGEYGALGERVCDFAARHDVRFAEGLERVDTECVALADLHDLRESQHRHETKAKK